jgi:diacylglycerol O-acyltransferase / wax synthase
MLPQGKKEAAMQSRLDNDRLSWGDTVFLHLEREGMPLNVASVCIFEGEISLAHCVRFVEAKLPLLPRYLKRIVPAPFGLGLPSWQHDPEFDLARHLHEATLRYGTEAELKDLAGKLFSKTMDRKHPLWDMTLVHGLKGNTALIVRLHHCLADGIAGVSLMNSFFDATPQVGRLPRRKIRLCAPPASDAWSALATGFMDSYSELVNRILSALEDGLNMAERVAANGRALPSDELSGLLPEITAATEPLRFNVTCRGPQKFAWTEASLAEIKSIKRKSGTSVNDVILALVTASFRRYLQLHGDRVKGRLLRMMVPVNMRRQDTPGDLGNRISLVPVTIPLDIRDPGKLLAAVHRRTEFLKHAHAAEMVSLAGGLVGMLPTSVQAVVGPVLSQLPLTPFNLVCTNVPGPQQPLYLLGHKMLRWYPYVPVGGDMAVNCAVLSYDGGVYFGFSGDVHAAPDLRRLEKLVQESFNDMCAAAGIATGKKERTRRKKVRASAPAKPHRAAAKAAPAVTAPATAAGPIAQKREQVDAVANQARSPAAATPGEKALAHSA